MSLGDAYLDVHGNFDPFDAELAAKMAEVAETVRATVTVRVNTVGGNVAPIADTTAVQRVTSSFDDSGTRAAEAADSARVASAQASAAQLRLINQETARQLNEQLGVQVAAAKAADAQQLADARASDAQRVAEAKAAAAAIKAANQATTDQLKIGLAQQVAEAKAAADATKAINQATTDQLKIGLAQQVAEAKAAAAAIKAANQQASLADRAVSATAAGPTAESVGASGLNKKELDALAAASAQETAQLRADAAVQAEAFRSAATAAQDAAARIVAAEGLASDAEKRLAVDTAAAAAAQAASYRAAADAAEAAAVKQKVVSDVLKETEKSAKDSRGALSGLSSTLGKLGFTGQTRLLTLALTVGAPVADLALFTAGAAAAAAAITVFGAKAADALNNAQAQFRTFGDSAAQAVKDVQQLQGIAEQGIPLAKLLPVTQALQQIGLSGKDANAVLQILGDNLAAAGESGTVLQQGLASSGKAIATLAESGAVTANTFVSSIKSLGLAVTQQDVFDQLKKNLDLTSKQLDALIAKKGLSGAVVANAALQVAQANSVGGLATAKQTSPTQALEAAGQTLQDTIVSSTKDIGPQIAALINGAVPQFQAAIRKFAPLVQAELPKIVSTIESLITPVTNAITASLPLATQLFKDLGPIIKFAADAVTGFFSQANKQGSATQKVLKDVRDILELIGHVAVDVAKGVGDVVVVIGKVADELTPVASVLKAIAESKVGSVLVEVASALATIALLNAGLGKVIEGLGKLVKFAASGPIVKGLQAVAGAFALVAEEGLAAAAAGVAADIAFSPIVLALSAIELPIVAAVAGIAALAAGFVLAYEKVKAFRDVVDDIGSVLRTVVIIGFDLVKAAVEGVLGVFVTLGVYIENTVGFFVDLAEKIPFVGTALHDLGDAAGVVGGAISSAFSGLGGFIKTIVNGILNAIEAILHGLADVAGFGGILNPFHGLADGANAAAHEIQGLRDSLNGIPDNTTKTLTVVTQEITLSVGSSTIGQQTGPANGNGVVPVSGGGLFGGFFNNTNGGAGAPVAAPRPTVPTLPGLGGSVGSGGGAGGGAASAAKAAANAIKAATKTFEKALTDFATAIGGDTTVAQVNSSFDTLRKAITAQDTALGKAEPKGLAAYVTKQQHLINNLARQVEAITTAIGAANTEITSALQFADVSQAAATAAKDLSKLVIVLPTVANALNTGSAAVAAAGSTFEAALQTKLKNLKDFAANIAKLQAEHLSPAIIQQLLAAGPDAAGATAADLAKASQDQVNAINSTQSQVTAAANSLGDEAAKASLAAGTSTADAFVKGLQGQQAALEKQMGTLAKSLVDAIDKDFKLSAQFKDVGTNIAAGVASGLTSKAAKKAIDDAGKELGNQALKSIKDALHIKSPSYRARVEVGHMLAHGIALGMTDKLGMLADHAQALAGAALPTAVLDKLGSVPVQRKLAVELTGLSGNEKPVTFSQVERLIAATQGAPRTTIHAPLHVGTVTTSGDDPAALIAAHSRAIAKGLR